jgi:hypothetical protein
VHLSTERWGRPVAALCAGGGGHVACEWVRLRLEAKGGGWRRRGSVEAGAEHERWWRQRFVSGAQACESGPEKEYFSCKKSLTSNGPREKTVENDLTFDGSRSFSGARLAVVTPQNFKF